MLLGAPPVTNLAGPWFSPDKTHEKLPCERVKLFVCLDAKFRIDLTANIKSVQMPEKSIE